MRKIHRAGVKSGNLVIGQISCDEGLRGKYARHAAYMSLLEIKTLQTVGIWLIVIPDGCHDEGFAAYHLQIVCNIAGTAAKFPSHVRYQKGHVQDMNFFRQDMVLEMILEHHNGVVGNGTTNECMHGYARVRFLDLLRRGDAWDRAEGGASGPCFR